MLIVANGFFSGAEMAVVALRQTRIQQLAEGGRHGARALLALKNNPERFLATVQVGITVVGATAAAVGGESIASRLAPMLAHVGWIGERAEPLALAIVVAGISYLSIVLGELVPKSLALRGAERFGLVIARPLSVLSWFATPLVWFLGSSANLVLRPFGDSTTFSETRYSAEELQDMVEQAARSGAIHPEAGEIAARALELPALAVADVKIPREDVVVIPRDASPEQLRRILLEQTHSRLPVYEGKLDNVVGYVSVKDLLAMAWDRHLIVLDDVMRPPYFVPDSKPAVELLKEMRARHLPFAIVVDEQGGMSGIVTLEDVLEELVGEIFSEHAHDVSPLVEKSADGTALVSGLAPIREIHRVLDIDLPDEGAWTTVAGLYLSVSGKIPAVGESVELDGGIVLEVVEASPRRIRTVRIRKTPPSSG